jgi:hypothetical protein
VPPPDSLEQAIIDDVFARTSWFVRRLGGYETDEEDVARDVLPILVEWLPRFAHRKNFRGGIYQRFFTPHAVRYVDTLIEWYINEESEDNRDLLVQALALLAGPEHAERLWALCQSRIPRDLGVPLLVKLCRFSAVEHEAKDALVEFLQGSPMPRLGDLQFISEVRDPRILEWFKRHLLAPNRPLRSIARRYVERAAKLPAGLVYAQEAPDRADEITSWEVDLVELEGILKEASHEFNLKIPARIGRGGFLEIADLDRWMVTRVAVKGGEESVSLWFRLEDIDIVEVVLNRQSIPLTS